MTILVADDEELARQRIIKLLGEAKVPGTIHESSSGKETITSISNIKPDLVFLDIQMTDMTGFDVLKNIDSKLLPIIVFVTAFDRFAVKAFEVQALDFLLKPYKKERFFEALHRSMEKLQLMEKGAFKSKVDKLMTYLNNTDDPLYASANSYIEKVVLKVGKKYYFILVEDIKYITSSAYYAEIHTKDDKKHIYRISMSEFIKKLNPRGFARINRSTILNLNEIKEVVSEGQGDYSIVMNDGNTFSLTKNFRNSFLEIIGIK